MGTFRIVDKIKEMEESQIVEYKLLWKDEYLKWICGFANAFGGTIFIGKDDSGNVVGIDNARKLLEDIPNKTRDILGVVVDINNKSCFSSYSSKGFCRNGPKGNYFRFGHQGSWFIICIKIIVP